MIDYRFHIHISRMHPVAPKDGRDRASSFRSASISSGWASLSSSSTSMSVLGNSSWCRRERASTGINHLLCVTATHMLRILHCRSGSRYSMTALELKMAVASVDDNTSDEEEQVWKDWGLCVGRSSRLKSTTISLSMPGARVFPQSLSLVPDWLLLDGPRIPTPHPLEHRHWRPR